jgi:deoxyribose-phosphate aldolase
MKQNIEYACYDYSINESETEKNIQYAIKAGITSFSVLPYSLSNLKNSEEFKNNNFSLGSPVDFPYGLSDTKSRNFMVSQTIKAGANVIDLFLPTKMIINRKYDKFREDIKSNFDICFEKNVKLRYILEYRVFNHEVLAKVCQILMSFGIDTILPSSGMMIDDIHDNIIACNYFLTKTGIKPICNGNIFNDNHVKLVNNSNVHGVRLHHLKSLDIIL